MMVACGKAARTAVLALALGAAVIALGLRVGADRGDVDESGHARRGGGLGDVAGAVHMHGLERALEDADQIDHRVRALDGGGDGGLVGDVGADELDLAEPAERLQIPGPARVALGGADADAGLQQRLGDVAAEKAAGAEHGHEDVRLGRHGARFAPVAPR